jgi:hypothetical protein
MFEQRIARYYNLHVKRYVFLNGTTISTLKRYMFLNGRRLDQLEYPSAPSVNSFGIAGTGFAIIIHAKLQHVRDAIVSYYP